MTGEEFKLARVSRLKYSQAELAVAMKTPKRTIQELEAAPQVRGCYEVLIELLIKDGVREMERIKANIDTLLDKQFPQGIPSEKFKE